MIKCPNCGSTSQVRMTFLTDLIAKDEYDLEFSCGCGCIFGVVVEIPEDKIHAFNTK